MSAGSIFAFAGQPAKLPETVSQVFLGNPFRLFHIQRGKARGIHNVAAPCQRIKASRPGRMASPAQFAADLPGFQSKLRIDSIQQAGFAYPRVSRQYAELPGYAFVQFRNPLA